MAVVTKSGYLSASRAPRYSLTFVLPLLLLYEFTAAALSESTQGVRNGADVMLKSLVARVIGPAGPMYFAIALIVVFLALIIRDKRRHPGPWVARYFAGMAIESVALALAFGLVVGVITARVVETLHLAEGALPAAPGLATPALTAGALDRLGAPGAIMLSLGAGIYEELLFRVLLVGALLLLGRHVMGWGPVASNTLAVVAGALVFSAFHYIGPFGDQLEAGSFVFRALSGLAFSGLYVWRGFGITAWTHALYDIFLVVAR